MKGYNLWSYAPYKPLLFNVGDIYICRIAPGANTIHFEWLGTEDKEYSVFFRKRNTDEFALYKKCSCTECDIEGLETNKDYEFYVECDGKKSRVRLAKTGEVVGTSIAVPSTAVWV